MNNIKTIILSIIFWLLLYCVVFFTVISYIIFSPFSKQKYFIDYCTKIWARICLFLLKNILKVDHEILGLKNLPQERPFIVACKHQSMWDTIVFHIILTNPSYIYKKELLKVPVYGWYVKKMPAIAIDRKGGAKALKDMVKKSKQFLKEGRQLIIFPQGTRTKPTESPENFPYQIGVAALYKACNVEVVPVALNSGKFWGKGMWIKKSGTIKLKFLEPIKTGYNKEEFMQILEEKIEQGCSKI